MKNLILKTLFFLLCAMFISNLSFGQLIQNGSFENGNIPEYDLTADPIVDEHPMPDDWNIGPLNFNCTGTAGAGIRPLVFDTRFVDHDIYFGNQYGTGHNIYQIYKGFSGNQVPVRSTGNRYIGFYGGRFDARNNRLPTGSEPYYGGNIVSELTEPLVAGCTYKISFWTIPIQSFTFFYGMGQINHSNNKIQVVFYKNGVTTPCDGWIAYTTKSIDVNPKNQDDSKSTITWEYCEALFTVPTAFAGADFIQFRMQPIIIGDNTNNVDARPTGVFIDDVSLTNESNATAFTPTTGFAFTNDNVTGCGQASPWSGRNIEINGTFTVNNDLTINNSSHIRFGPSAVITVQSGITLTINSSLLDGSCDMWQGIVVQSGGKIVFTSNTLHDAVTGIKVTGTTSEFTIHSNTFEASHTHIELNDCKTQGTSNIIHGNNFIHNIPLKDPSLSAATGKGVFGIKVGSIQSTNEITIGKSEASGGGKNIFENGYIGILIYKSNVNIKFSEFKSTSSTEISFGIKSLGNRYTKKVNPSEVRPYGYSLKFSDEVVFSRCNTGIIAEDNYNLEIFKSTFISNTIGISCTRSNDRKLIIGSDDGSTRNTFIDCKTGILLFDNHTLESCCPASMSSEIRVSNCDFLNRPFGIGVVIAEPFRSTETRIYTKLDIRDNTFLNIGLGIKLSNITGVEKTDNAKYLPDLMPPSFLNKTYAELEVERVVSNTFTFTNKLNPEYIGIKVENTRGFRFLDNTFSHIDPRNWQNKGIWLDNSEYSNIRNNTFVSGTGILAAGTMFHSNILCNSFNEGVTGIQLAWEYLRPASKTNTFSYIHGKNHVSARNNFFNDMQSFGQDMELWNTEPQPHNRWVWAEGEDLPKVIQFLSKDNSHTDVAANMGTSFWTDPPAPLEAPFDCDPNLMVDDEDEDDDFEDEDTAYSFPRHVSWWNNTYYWERRYSAMDSLIGARDTTIAKIINIEKNIDTGNYNNATTLLGAFSPRNNIETTYAYLLGLIIEMKDSTFDGLDSTQASNVNIIASQQTIAGGIPVFIARAILFYDLGIDYSTIDDDYYPTLKGKLIDTIGCVYDSLQNKSGIALVDENLNRVSDFPIVYPNSSGEFTFNPHLLRTIDSNTVVGFITWPSKDITTLNPEFKSIEDWMDTTFNEIYTTGITVSVIDPGDSIIVFINDTIINPDASTYSVENMHSGSDNFLVSKLGGFVSWLRELNGYMNTNDKAIGIKKHDNGNLYIVSNLIIDDWKGFEVWCLDTFGNLVWKHTHYDTLMEYEALGFDTTAWGGVKVAVSSNDGLGGGDILQVLEINTCQTYQDIFDTFFEEQEEEGGGEGLVASSTKINNPFSIKVMPNPNHGNFIVEIENSNNRNIFELYNLQGVKVYERDVKEGTNKIQLFSTLSKGIYIGKVTDLKTKHQTIIRIAID